MSEAAPNLVLIHGFLPEFNIGATVRLKSGGPLMTVTAIEDRHVEVQWFEGTSGALVMKQKVMPVASLKAATRIPEKAS